MNRISKLGVIAYFKKYSKSVFFGKKHTQEYKDHMSKIMSVKAKGEGNYQYGTCWIKNDKLESNHRIDKSELKDWIDKGWLRGRKMSYTKYNNGM